MINLILDTSTDRCLLALAEENRLIRSNIYHHKQNLSQDFLTNIQNLLSDVSPSHISIGIGPGSYTGTRIGVSVAISLSLALSVPLLSFCSLLAFLPPSLSEGPFRLQAPSTHSSALLLSASFHQGAIESPSWTFLPKEQIPSSTFPISSEVNLPPLLTYLFQESQKNLFSEPKILYFPYQ
jgi:tRNA threonylcarbamoyl adenosine modification protein YeaZ